MTRPFEPETMFLFPGMPGGIELLVIFVVMVVLFGIPLALVALGVVLVRSTKGDGDVDEEVAALREEVAELRAAIQAGAADVGTDADEEDDTETVHEDGTGDGEATGDADEE